jgi:hypothetical protein
VARFIWEDAMKRPDRIRATPRDLVALRQRASQAAYASKV